MEVKPKNYKEVLLAVKNDLQKLKIKKNATNPFYKKEYADLPNIMDGVLPTTLSYNLLHTFDYIVDLQEDTTTMSLEVELVGGIEGENTSKIKITQKGVLSDIQKIGSLQTYCRRYLLILFYDLRIYGDDDDGNGAVDNQNKSKGVQKPPYVAPKTIGNIKTTKTVGGVLYTWREGEYGGKAYSGWYPPKDKRLSKENPTGSPIYETDEDIEAAIIDSSDFNEDIDKAFSYDDSGISTRRGKYKGD